MEIKILTKEDFLNNQAFLSEHLGKVFNYDYFEDLKNDFKHRDITVQNFNQHKNEILAAVFEGHKEKLAQNPDVDIFWVMACDEKGIYSLATFENVGGEYDVDAVTTRHGYRRRGLAEKVLRAGLERAKGKCFLWVDKNNKAAQALYKKLGFRLSDPSGRAHQVDGSYFMTRDGKSYGKENEYEKND